MTTPHLTHFLAHTAHFSDGSTLAFPENYRVESAIGLPDGVAGPGWKIATLLPDDRRCGILMLAGHEKERAEGSRRYMLTAEAKAAHPTWRSDPAERTAWLREVATREADLDALPADAIAG